MYGHFFFHLLYIHPNTITNNISYFNFDLFVLFSSSKIYSKLYLTTKIQETSDSRKKNERNEIVGGTHIEKKATSQLFF